MDEISSDEDPPSNRSDPSGASNDPEEIITSPRVNNKSCEHFHCPYTSRKFEDKLKNLEEEHEMLNSSLCALTTHFAQVQFRLRQAVAAPQADKESFLKSLEEFAFRGIPDIGVVRERIDEAQLTETIWVRRVQQQRLIEKLKSQIRELEDLFKSERMRTQGRENHQTNIFNEFKLWINLDLSKDKYYELSTIDIKEKIQIALEKLERPLKMKEELVQQLKTQVADLERFINYLQEKKHIHNACACCAVHPLKPIKRKETTGIIKRTVTLLHMFAILYLGCSPKQLNKKHVNHWGDLRASLEIDIESVLEAFKSTTGNKSIKEDYNSDDESSCPVSNLQVTMVVRKHLAISIRDLMLHGANRGASIHRLIPFIGCFKQKFKIPDTPIHAWEIILKYYNLNKGDKFNSTPVRKLSQSFNLNIIGDSSQSNKDTMLSEIGKIISTHAVYKSSYDSHFKAFICAALNANKLVIWLRLIFQCRTLVDMYYESWSYVIKTRFSDSLHSLDALTNLKFDLPVDIAIRRFQNIEDVFI